MFKVLATFLLGLTLAAGPLRADAPTLRIGYTDQESPFFVMGNGSEIPQRPGIAVEIINYAAERCGIDVKPARYPGGRLLALIGDNTIDSVLMLSFSPERQAIAAYPPLGDTADPAYQLATLSYAFYVRKESGIAWDGETISGLKKPIGANFGWSIADDLRKRGFPVETAQDTQNNFNKLLGDRIDAFAIQTSIGDPYVTRNGLGDSIATLEPPISSKPYYQVFSRSWYETYPDAAQCMWQQTARIRDQDMPALLSRYHDSIN